MRPRGKPKPVTAKKSIKASIANEKKAVKKRLMQISLRLDDHIYKNKLISVESAKLYIQEIAALKHQCYQDVPSLQVVEKLTRIMRAITVGEGSTHNDDYSSKPRSPAISSPDINSTRSQQIISQEQEVNNQNNTETVESIALESTVINNVESVQTVIATLSDITELTQNVGDLTRAIYTLSVHDTENAITNAVEKDDELSLNLLDNYSSLGDLNNCGQGFKDKNPIGEGNFEIEVTKGTEFTCLESNASETPYTDNILDTNNELAEDLLNDLNLCGQGFEEYEKALKISNSPVDPTTKIMTQGKMDKVHNTSVKSDNRSDFSKRLGRSKSDDTKKQNKRNKDIQTQKPRKRKTKTLTPKKAKITNYFAGETQSQPDPPKKVAKKKKTTAFVPPIKEQNNKETDNSLPTQPDKMEIGLSWVETLKYVRQIDEDEFSSVNALNESFWKNCEFPPNFDENDFNYS